MPKVSVVIPVYNVEKYLRECLDSVINQTLKDIEIICINDGSPDNSIEILKEYEKNDSRIVVIDKENEGVGKSRNQGINAAKGEFVCFMDPDDLYPTLDVLEVLYNAAIDNNVKICGGEFSEFIDGTHDYKQNYSDTFSGYLFDKDGIIEYRDYQFDYGYHRFIYNREFLLSNSIYFPSYKRFQDPPFFVKAMILAERFFAVDKIVYAYRYDHCVVSWTKEKINDLLCGLIDDVNFAKKYKLTMLQNYTHSRFKEHFRLCPHIFNIETINKCFKIMGIELVLFIVVLAIKKLIQTIFSIRNSGEHKVITILCIKIKIKRKSKNK